MKPEPRFVQLPEKKLIGTCLNMSHANNRTAQLWQGFMPRRREISNAVNTDLISMQVYPANFDFARFNPLLEFEKWATVEVTDFDVIPPQMESFILSGGLYAVFLHRGSSTDTRTFQYIFGEWLPKSEYMIDQRPHFELLGEKYKNNHPDSEEEIWVPVRGK